MKKLALLLFISFSFCSITRAQDFTFEELTKLRKMTFNKFESAVHDKGYGLNHLEDERDGCTVFRNGCNVISYCHYCNDGHGYRNHVAVKFETASSEVYEKVKRGIEANMKYYKTQKKRYKSQHYVEHVYISDDLVVHIYDIAYRDDPRPYYEIEVFSVLGDYGYSNSYYRH
jgi:hypothetical protein